MGWTRWRLPIFHRLRVRDPLCAVQWQLCMARLSPVHGKANSAPGASVYRCNRYSRCALVALSVLCTWIEWIVAGPRARNGRAAFRAAFRLLDRHCPVFWGGCRMVGSALLDACL